MEINTTRRHRGSQLKTEKIKAEPKNRVYIENGEVKFELVADKLSIEEAKNLTLKMVELEYSLP